MNQLVLLCVFINVAGASFTAFLSKPPVLRGRLPEPLAQDANAEIDSEIGKLTSNAASDWKSAEDVEHVVLNMLNSSVTPGMADLVGQIGAMIENDMKPKVLKEHNDTVALLEQLFAAFKTCTTQRSTAEETGNLDDLQNAAKGAKSNVDSCEQEKEGMKGPVQECNETLPVLDQLADSDCKAKDEAEKNPDAMICDPTVADSYETWINRLEEYFEGELGHVAEKVEKCDNATKDAAKKKEECDPILEDEKKKAEECNDKDEDKKGKLCAFYTTVKGICKAFEDCNAAARLAYENAKAKIIIQVADRKVEWEALERIKCMLGAFGTSEDGTTSKSTINACRKADHDTSHLDITFHELPPPVECLDVLGDLRTEAERECEEDGSSPDSDGPPSGPSGEVQSTYATTATTTTTYRQCFKIVTGVQYYDAGYVNVRVNGNLISGKNKKYKLGDVVVTKCYDQRIQEITIDNADSNNCWIGSIQYSQDGGVTYNNAICEDCGQNEQSTQRIGVDGNSDCLSSAPVACQGGKSCTVVMSANYCVRITTGNTKWDDGPLTVWVNSPTQEATSGGSSKYSKGQVVLNRCYLRPVDYLYVQNPTNNGWVGTIEYSTNGGSTYYPMNCIGCTGSTPKFTSNIVVDGNSDGASEAPVDCLSYEKCKVVP